MNATLARAIAKLLSPSGSRARLAVFTYHQVLDDKDPLRPDEPTEAEFLSDMQVISEIFNVLPFGEAALALKRGSLPARAAVITFDDGYANNHRLVAPILESMSLPASFFVTGGAVDEGVMWNDLIIEAYRRVGDRGFASQEQLRSLFGGEELMGTLRIDVVLQKLKYIDLEERWQIASHVYREFVSEQLPRIMMTREQVRDLSSRGFEIGAHTIDHPILEKIPDERADKEICDSFAWVEAVAGESPLSFAYPNGRPGVDFSQRHQDMAMRAGFVAAASTAWGLGTARRDMLSLPRIGPWWRDRSLAGGCLRTYAGSYISN
jgi:peptidoglycan/xylan/chitin deacetylase (PgdA/CDA1 family)